MIRTLKARTTLWNVLVIASALSLFAVLLYAWLANTLYGHHDGDLRDEAKRVLASVSSTTDPIAALQALDKEGAVAPYLMVRDTHGNVVFRSERLAKAEPEIGAHEVLTHAATSGVTVEQFFTVHLARGPVRFTCVPLATPSETYLQLGRPLGDVGMMLEVVTIASLVLIPVVIVITSFGGFLIARRALRPVEVIAKSLESIQATDLSRRIDPHAPDTEVKRLTSSINQLLDRLGTSFRTMREFTADVSHQLQTPMTVMKGTIDASRNGSAEDRARALDALSDEVSALTATLQDLRDLALADADSAEARVGPVVVSDVFAEAGELVGALAEAHAVTCETAIQPGLRVWGNAVRLRQLILNLGENAVEFTPPGGRIRIEAAGHDGMVVAKVSDTGIGIAPELLPHVFDRHVHGKPPGTKSRSGLGLAIVKRIVDAHGGRVTIESTVGSGTTALVTLPTADSSQS
jgi:signal transduction histidine kinase